MKSILDRLMESTRRSRTQKLRSSRSLLFAASLLTVSLLPYCRAAQTNQPPQIILNQTLNTKTCYVGEPLTLSIKWHSLPAIGRFKSVDIRVPLMATNTFKIYNSHKKKDQPDANSLGIPLGGTRAIAHVTTTRINAHEYTTLSTSKVAVPTTSETFSIPAASITCFLSRTDIPHAHSRSHRPKGSGNLYQYPVYFNNNFFDLDVDPGSKKLQTKSNPIQIKVLPLPQPAPQPFNGLVGNYTLAITATTNSIRQGDPLMLKLKISSAKNYLEPTSIPPLQDYSGFTNSFKVIADRRLSAITDNSITFEQTVFPLLEPGTHTFPALQLTCFDPNSKTFKTSKSKSFDYTITKARTIGDDNTDSNTEAKHHIMPLIYIIIIVTAILLWWKRNQPQTEIQSSPQPDIRQARLRLETELEKIRKSSQKKPRQKYNDLNTALTNFFGTQLTDYTPGAITTHDISKLIEKLKPAQEIRDTAAELLRNLDFQRFAPQTTSTDLPDITADINAALTLAKHIQ